VSRLGYLRGAPPKFLGASVGAGAGTDVGTSLEPPDEKLALPGSFLDIGFVGANGGALDVGTGALGTDGRGLVMPKFSDSCIADGSGGTGGCALSAGLSGGGGSGAVGGEVGTSEGTSVGPGAGAT